jgi:hypothetical protein
VGGYIATKNADHVFDDIDCQSPGEALNASSLAASCTELSYCQAFIMNFEETRHCLKYIRSPIGQASSTAAHAATYCFYAKGQPLLSPNGKAQGTARCHR